MPWGRPGCTGRSWGEPAGVGKGAGMAAVGTMTLVCLLTIEYSSVLCRDIHKYIHSDVTVCSFVHSFIDTVLENSCDDSAIYRISIGCKIFPHVSKLSVCRTRDPGTPFLRRTMEGL